MKRFILGTLAGILIVAAIVTMIPERAHSLIDQAGDIRNMLNDVVARLEQMEQRDSSSEIMDMEFIEHAAPTHSTEVADFDLPADAKPEHHFTSTSEVEIQTENPLAAEVSIPESVERQSMNFDNLAEGLARVSGALERLNRTMKPGRKASPRSNQEVSNTDESAS